MHDVRRADSRAPWTAGKSRPMSVAMIAITTSSSTNVNPRRGSTRLWEPDRRRRSSQHPQARLKHAKAATPGSGTAATVATRMPQY